MTNVSCATLECGVVFGLPEHIYNQAKENPGRWFWCPNGHRQHYSRDALAELRAEVERKQATINRLSGSVTQRDKTISYWRGIVTRLKNRGNR